MSNWILARWVALLILFLVTLGVVVSVVNFHSKKLTVSFLDVGQGDAIFITAPNGNQVLIDAGAGRQVLRSLGAVMPFYDKTIDLVIGTHADADHIGGMSFVLERFTVLGIISNGVGSQTDSYELFTERSQAEQAKNMIARQGMRIVLDKNVFLDILFPREDMGEFETNDGSIVARLVYGDNEFLLTGDLPQNREMELVGRFGSLLESDVLKLGHHGSKTSSSAYFLDQVKPKLGIISAGKDNRYGHPHQIVLERLTSKNISYLNTADMGTITLESDGDQLVCKKCGR